MVNEVFANVASKYDIMNDAMSLGIHRIWKNEFVNSIGEIRPNIIEADKDTKTEKLKIVDVAGGTGDIAFKIWNRANYFSTRYFTIMPAHITVVDINPNMLEVGKLRALEFNIPEQDINFIEGNAERIEFLSDNSIDLYTIAFGIRNCTNIPAVLKEAHWILKKGGRFMCLEFSHVTIPGLNYIYDFYSHNIIPELGHLIAGDRDSYKYLVESIRKFPNQEQFKKMISDAGFEGASYVNLSGGMVAIHSGIKL